MATDVDMTQYLDLFLQEAEEQLQILEVETLKLEQDPNADRLSLIFRAAHTLKGSARAMGFGDFANLTHEMENLLDALRMGRLFISSEIADCLLRCIDSLGEMKSSIVDSGSDALEVGPLVSELVRLQSGEVAEIPLKPTQPVAEFTSDELAILNAALETGPVVVAEFLLIKDCLMPFARAMMAVRAASDVGELVTSVPNAEALEEERFDRAFTLYIRTDHTREQLQEEFSKLAEMESVKLSYYGEPTEEQAEPVDVAVEAIAAPTEPEAKPETTVVEAAAAAATTTTTRKESANQTVRVDVTRLDELMNLVGELVIDRTRISQIGASLAAKYDLDEHVEALAETVGHVSRITAELQDILLKARMMPIETVFARMPRAVRDLAKRVDKQIIFETSGGETEVDRSVIESMSDPLLHILRNSIDHGIETPEEREAAGKPREGRVTVTARHHEGFIVVEIIDDGRGIDTAKVKAKAIERGILTREAADRMSEKEALSLIYASGLSTASAVSDISGRGVGMDIVRANVQSLGGIIDIDSERGKGSRFTLRLPLTLAIIRGLFVEVDKQTYILPLMSVIETLRLADSDVQTIAGRRAMVLRGSTMSLVSLGDLLRTGENLPTTEARDRFVVVVGLAEERVGLVVDRLIGEQEVVIKSLSRFLGEVKGISGATILGNGHVALIADVNGLLGMAKELMS